MEFGLNDDSTGNERRGNVPETTSLILEPNIDTILSTLFAKVEKEKAKFVTVEIFVRNEQTEENLITYASIIPVYNDQSKFTKFWKNNKNFFKEKMKTQKDILYFVIKELDQDENLLMTHYLYKDLIEAQDEDN